MKKPFAKLHNKHMAANAALVLTPEGRGGYDLDSATLKPAAQKKAPPPAPKGKAIAKAKGFL